jgi:hypothetical protein
LAVDDAEGTVRVAPISIVGLSDEATWADALDDPAKVRIIKEGVARVAAVLVSIETGGPDGEGFMAGDGSAQGIIDHFCLMVARRRDHRPFGLVC